MVVRTSLWAPEERVLLALRDSLEFVATCYAVLKIGAVVDEVRGRTSATSTARPQRRRLLPGHAGPCTLPVANTGSPTLTVRDECRAVPHRTRDPRHARGHPSPHGGATRRCVW